MFLLHTPAVNLQQCNPVRDSTVLWLIRLMPGLSLVILRQITQDYDLMGSVKSAGKHQRPFSKESLRNAAHTSQIMNCWGATVDQKCISKGNVWHTDHLHIKRLASQLLKICIANVPKVAANFCKHLCVNSAQLSSQGLSTCPALRREVSACLRFELSGLQHKFCSFFF